MSKLQDCEYCFEYVKKHWPGFSVTAQDLENPTAEFAKTFFMHYVDDFDRLLIAMGNLPDDFQINHEQSSLATEVSLYICMNIILKNSGIEFFTLHEIYSPSKKRFQTIFRVSLNVLIFMRQILKDAQKITGDLQKMLDLKINLKLELETLKTLLNEMAVKIALNDNKLILLSNEHKQLLQDFQNIKRSEEKEVELMKIKQELSQLKGKCVNIQKSVEKLTEEEKLLQEQVALPEEVENCQKEHDQLKSEIQTLDEYSSEYHNTLKNKQLTLENFTSLEKTAKTIDYKHLDIVNGLKKPQNDIQDLNNRLCVKNIEIQNCDLEKLKINENIRCIEEASCKTHVQLMAAKKSLRNEVDEYGKVYENSVEENKKLQNHVKIFEDKIADVEDECTSIRNDNEMLRVGVEEEYRLLLESENTLTTYFHQCLNNTSKLFENTSAAEN